MAARKQVQKDTYTVTEVGTLIEALRTDIRLIAEEVVSIRREVDGSKAWRATADHKFLQIDLILTELRALRTDLKAVESKVGL